MAGGQLRDLEHFVDILETLDAIVWEADASTFEFTYVSDGAVRMLGYPTDKWIGNPGFWESLIHPDGRERTIAFCKSARGTAEIIDSITGQSLPMGACCGSKTSCGSCVVMTGRLVSYVA